MAKKKQIKFTKKEIESLENLRNAYAFIQNSGSFPNTYHSENTTDVMGKWAVQIDNICWALFGCEIKYEYNKENRMYYINNKLEHIHEELKLYIPGRC